MLINLTINGRFVFIRGGFIMMKKMIYFLFILLFGLNLYGCSPIKDKAPAEATVNETNKTSSDINNDAITKTPENEGKLTEVPETKINTTETPETEINITETPETEDIVDMQKDNGEIQDSETVLQVPLQYKDEYNIEIYDDTTGGPDSFYIDGENIIICNTLKSELLIFKKNEFISRITYRELYFPEDIFIDSQGDIYTLVSTFKEGELCYKIVKIDKEGNELLTLDIPDNRDDVDAAADDLFYPEQIKLWNDEIILTFIHKQEYRFQEDILTSVNTFGYEGNLGSDKPFIKEKSSGKNIYFYTYGNPTGIYVLKKDINNIYYLEVDAYDQDEESFQVITDNLIYLIQNNKAIKVISLPEFTDNHDYLSPNNIRITDNGDVYHMAIVNGILTIYKLKPQDSYISRIKTYFDNIEY
jgi:hypothetical protein